MFAQSRRNLIQFTLFILGVLRYLLQCRSIVVGHETPFIQHFHHLFNSTLGSDQQNMIIIPGRQWTTLRETMEYYLSHDKEAEDLADRASRFWRFYNSKASIDCYWRHIFKIWAELQNWEPDTRPEDPHYTSYE